MNFKFLYTLPILVLAGFVLSFSNGPAGGDGGNGPRLQDRSGSPFAIAQGPTCAACHNNGSFDSGVTIELLDNGASVDNYVPEQNYTLRYTVIANSGTPSKYGVQSVILKNSNNINAGTFGDPPTGTRVAAISTRRYFEHTTPSSTNAFEIEWTAPEAGTGEITVYAGGAAVNGNGTNGGDNGAGVTLVLTEILSAISSPVLLPVEVKILPNPVADIMSVNIQSEISGKVSIQLLDTTGKNVLSGSMELNNGINTFDQNIAHLPAGTYLQKLTDGQKVKVEKVVKR